MHSDTETIQWAFCHTSSSSKSERSDWNQILLTYPASLMLKCKKDAQLLANQYSQLKPSEHTQGSGHKGCSRACATTSQKGWLWVMVGENGTGSTWGLCLLAKRSDVETRQPHHLYTTPSVTTSRCYECSTFYMNTLQTREDNEETERQCEIATIIYTCHFLQKWGFEAIGVHRPLLNMVKELERAHIITGYELESCFHARTADIACVVLTITVTWH